MKLVKKRAKEFSITGNLGYNKRNNKRLSKYAQGVLPATREIKGG